MKRLRRISRLAVILWLISIIIGIVVFSKPLSLFQSGGRRDGKIGMKGSTSRPANTRDVRKKSAASVNGGRVKKKGARRGMNQEILSRYMWIEAAHWEAACLSFVRSRDEDEVLRRFGADLATEKQITLSEAADEEDEDIDNRPQHEPSPSLFAGRIGEWVVTIEDNGYEGSRHEVAQQVSRDTEMVSVFWNINMSTKFTYAVDGREVVSFDLLFPEERQGSDPDRLLDYMLELPFNPENSLASAFALAELITGVRLEKAWIEKKHRFVKIVSLPQEPHPDSKPEHTELVVYHPDVAAAIRNAATASQRRIAFLAAERAATETGLVIEPAIKSALDALQEDAPTLAKHRASLVPIVQRLEQSQWASSQEPSRMQETIKLSHRTFTGYAIRNALLPDSLMAALFSVFDASKAVTDKEQLLRDVIFLANQSPGHQR